MFVRTTEPDQAEVGMEGRSKIKEQRSKINLQIVPPTKPSEAPTACYFCQKCKNHGVLKWKKVRGVKSEELKNYSLHSQLF